MDGFGIEKPFPKTDGCIVIGRMPGNILDRLMPKEHLLWIVDGAGISREQENISACCKHTEILILDSASRWEAVLTEFLLKMPRLLPSLYVTNFIPPELQTEYTDLIGKTVVFLEEEYRARVTRQQDAYTWQCHLLENLADYVMRRVPDEWEGALAGIPAFVCGAGPSFAVSAPALAHLADKGVIFAGDSSLKALSKLGVKADFVVSTDMAKTPEKCMPQDTIIPQRAILGAISPPGWADGIPIERRYYLSGNQLTLDWLAQMGVQRTKCSVYENCGATAIALAHFMGCSPIYIFGMDLSLSEEGSVQRHHSDVDKSTYANSGFNAKQNFPRVPGNFADTVPTHVLGDWKALDERIVGYPEGTVIVVSDRGAKLRNTTVIRPEELSLPLTSVSPKDKLDSLPEPAETARASITQIKIKINQFGKNMESVLPQLRRQVQSGAIQEVVQWFRRLLVMEDAGKMLGAYSLKLMPCLLPPVETDKAFWENILNELEELVRLYLK